MTSSKKTYEEYLSGEGQSKRTIERIKKQVLHFTNWLENRSLESVTYEKMVSYLESCRSRGLGEGTLQNYLNWLRLHYDYLLLEKVVTKNPVSHLKLRRGKRGTRRNNLLQEVLSESDLLSCYELYVKNKRLSLRSKVQLGLYVFQGLSSGEEELLRIKDVLLEKGELKIPSSTRHESRILLLKSRQLLDLLNWMEGKKRESLLLEYKNKSHGANARFHLIHQLNRELRKGGIIKEVWNVAHLRRSVIVSWLSQYPLREVQYYAGHRWVSSTEQYRRGNIEELRSALNVYHPLKD